MKKNNLRSKRSNSIKSRIISYNIPNQNMDYDILKNDIGEQNINRLIQGCNAPQDSITNESLDTNIQQYSPSQQGPGPVSQSGQQMPNIKIKSIYKNNYIISGSEDILYASDSNFNQCNTFRIIPINNTQIILNTLGERFVRVNDKGELSADANRDKATRFTIYRNGPLIFSLLTPNGMYVEVISRDSKLLAGSNYASARTLFMFREVRS